MSNANLLMQIKKDNTSNTVNVTYIEVTFDTKTKNSIHLPFVLV